MSFTQSEWEGVSLLGRYALSPNQRGYCGGPDNELWARVARGERAEEDLIIQAARRLSGAWAYMHVLSTMTGLSPFSVEIARQYWLGEGIRGVDNATFGQALLDYIRPQASQYWAHLNESLLAEARPTHTFHVLAIYPWSHLLATHISSSTKLLPESPQLTVPLEVLGNCLILPAQLIEVTHDALLCRSSSLHFMQSEGLCLGEVEQHIPVSECGPALNARLCELQSGDFLSLHWGNAIDILSPEIVDYLQAELKISLKQANHRLGF